MKVGEYIRTKDGYIYKIEDGEEFYEDSVDVGIGVIPDVDGIWVDKTHFQYVDKRDVVKSSPNIIDLIEVGDIIRGKDNHLFEVYAVGSDCVYINNLEEFILIKDIKGIVTKEQFSQMEYRIGE